MLKVMGEIFFFFNWNIECTCSVKMQDSRYAMKTAFFPQNASFRIMHAFAKTRIRRWGGADRFDWIFSGMVAERKLICGQLIWDFLSSLVSAWKPLLDSLLENERNETYLFVKFIQDNSGLAWFGDLATRTIYNYRNTVSYLNLSWRKMEVTLFFISSPFSPSSALLILLFFWSLLSLIPFFPCFFIF